MGVDYYHYGFIGWRVAFGDLVEWCRENDIITRNQEDSDDDWLPIEEAIYDGTIAGLLSCYTTETGSGSYDGIDAAVMCIYVNEDCEGDYNGLSSVAEADYDLHNDGKFIRDIQDKVLYKQLMTKWGPKLKEVKARAAKLGLRLGEPQIFLDLKLS